MPEGSGHISRAAGFQEKVPFSETSKPAKSFISKRLLPAIPPYLRFLFLVYILGIIFFTIPRLVLWFQHAKEMEKIPAGIILQALWMGLRFDTVVSSYFLALPLLLFSFAELSKWKNGILKRLIIIYLTLVYSLGSLAGTANIPYFNHFNSPLTVSVLNWADRPGFMAGLIIQDSSYYPYIGLFLLMSLGFIYSIRTIGKITLKNNGRIEGPSSEFFPFRWMFLSVFALGALFLGIRGRTGEKSPIRWGTAFFSRYSFPNQLGLNPVYTFFNSWLEARNPQNRYLHFMDDETAIGNVRQFLNLPPTSDYPSPIARAVRPTGERKNFNVVLVLMENMAARNMALFGNPNRLTPCLDSLAANHSYCFTHFYAAGIHTYNGIFSTLFGFPALLNKHPMKTMESMQPFTGLAHTLAENSYQTIFFCPHDEQFDNMGGFLSANGFQKIVSQKDYPREKVLSTLGVPDGFMFQFSIPHLNRLHRNNQPFLAVFLTASNHGPYIIPEDIAFQPRSGEIQQQTVAYADWSIGQFMQAARRQPWYENSIFVFVADHGYNVSSLYDISLSLHHIPLLIHAPPLIDASKRIDAWGSQVDAYPTIMGLLNIPYVNNTLGTDLLREKRPLVCFGADGKLGCLSEDFFWIRREDGKKSLYRYKNGESLDYIEQCSEEAKKMETYAQSILQTAQWMISNHRVKPQQALGENKDKDSGIATGGPP